MKRFLAILMAAAIALSLCSCGGFDDGKTKMKSDRDRDIIVNESGPGHYSVEYAD